jgi:type I restriction enzyme S subunit
MSFPRYPKYKASGVEWLGDVPAHWEVRRLKNVLHQPITDGPHLTPEFIADGVPFLSVDAIQDGELNFAACRFISAVDHAEFKRKAAPRRDDILMGKAASTGKIARVKVDTEFSIWSPLALIRVKSDVSANWCEFVLKSRQCQSQIDVLCTSNTQKNISMGDIPLLALALPPLPEQRAIAAFLDRETAKIDGLVAEQRRLIELLKEKRKAVISHAVTKGLDPAAPMKPSGVEWLGEVPAHWEVRRLKTAIRSIEQGWSPQCEGEPVESDQEWGVLKAGCANGGVFRPEENKRLPASLAPLPELGVRGDDLLVSRANTRELVGSAAVAPCDFPRLLICDKIYRLRFRQELAEPHFICRFLCSSAARSQIELGATGASASMLNIGQSVILELPIPMPSTTEQRRIVAALDSRSAEIDALVAEAESAITLLQERRSALISAAVTGQIDVRNAVATEAA